VVRIGRREIEMLVCAITVVDAFDELRGSMDYDEFWRHSLRVADAAEFIATQRYPRLPCSPQEAYLSGLLHDIGKLVLNYYFPDSWLDVRDCADRHECDDATAERATLGVDHGELAARLMLAWGLQAPLQESIRWHHRVSDCRSEFGPFADLVNLADSMTHSFEQHTLPAKSARHDRFPLGSDQISQLARTLEKASSRASLILA